ncbi:MAG: helix-turn-helix transcriptional regulator [Alphaproteobacteria bacterium]|nr:helix-turn-helix transcriptional regulator [Alphaproteobacteria bacterium]MBL0717909.1 helix-turn-helix transcriptional regulator [Alphaproteobacteria bacterium]
MVKINNTTKTDPVDIHVGGRIRIRRRLLGITQDDIATRVGVTFQQIQKYETSTNRISAGRLYRIGEQFGVPVAYFFEGLPGQVASQRVDDILMVGDKKDRATIKAKIKKASLKEFSKMFSDLDEDHKIQIVSLMESFKRSK